MDICDKAGQAVILRGEKGNQHRRRDDNQIIRRAVHRLTGLAEDMPRLVTVPEKLQQHQQGHHHNHRRQRGQTKGKRDQQHRQKDNDQPPRHRPQTVERQPQARQREVTIQPNQRGAGEKQGRQHANRDGNPGIDRRDEILADRKGDEKG